MPKTYFKKATSIDTNKNSSVNTYRKHAIYTGILFLVTDITSIIALLIYLPFLRNAEYITTAGVSDISLLTAAFLEILLAFAAAGTALALYPVLKKQNLSLALGYVAARTAEGIVIMVGIMSLLTVLALRHDFLALGADPGVYQAIGRALVTLHDFTFLFGPGFILSVNATILGYLLYKSKLVPQWIALLAFIFGPLLFISNTGVLFRLYEQIDTLPTLLAMPMLLFEVSFALYLIFKGFKPKALAALEA